MDAVKNEFFHAVALDKDKCKGCINCIKRCPTGAIRVRDGKASIIKEFCIDCAECIRVCPHHAKLPTYDPLETLLNFEYKVALPAPAIYAQFNNLDDIGLVNTALKKMGFDEVYEVMAAAEQISEMSRKFTKENPDKMPLISSACPAVARLIRIRFPNLLEHLSKFNAPVDFAAKIARQNALEKTGLPTEKIGIFFISPCPAKVTSVRAPLGIEKSEVDYILAIKEVYPVLLPLLKEAETDNDIADIAGDAHPTSGRIGIGWGNSGGEAGGMLTDSYLAADGIENVIKVLEDLEDRKFEYLEFIELNACSGGCVGGVLNVENPYVAQAKLKKLGKYLPVSANHIGDNYPAGAFIDKQVEYKSVFSLGKNFMESLKLMGEVRELIELFPCMDCGACGAPSCQALAEDIARGKAKKEDCVFLNRENNK